MADTRFVVEYPSLRRHREELIDQRRQRNRRLMILVPAGLLLVILAGAWSLPLGVLLAAVSACTVFFAALPGTSSVDSGHLAGAEGEAAVLEQLAALSDDFVIINRLRLPDETLPNGERELDFVVAGPYGLWVLEVKNTPGHVKVRPDEKHWPLVRRAGCGSRPGWHAMPNPVPQAQAQARALEHWLLRHGIDSCARAAVVLAHPEVLVEGAELAQIPVLHRAQLPDWLAHKGADTTALPRDATDQLIAAVDSGLRQAKTTAPGRPSRQRRRSVRLTH